MVHSSNAKKSGIWEEAEEEEEEQDLKLEEPEEEELNMGEKGLNAQQEDLNMNKVEDPIDDVLNAVEPQKE